MAKRATLTPRKSNLPTLPWRVNLPATMTGSGKRERRFFKTKTEADSFCQQQRIRLDNYGRKSTNLSPSQLEQAAIAFTQLPEGVTLNEVVREYLDRHAASAKSVTFKVMFERFQELKADASKHYIRDLKYTLKRFPALHERLVSAITPAEIEGQLDGIAKTARKNFMAYLRASFNFGIKRDWLSENPMDKLDFEKVRMAEVVVLSTQQAAAIMAATTTRLDLLPYHALGLFAGIRPMELERLEWADVDMVEGHITIRPTVSKTKRRRIIDMEPNLRAWLAWFIEAGGKAEGKIVDSTNLRSRLRELRQAAGIAKWHQDVIRHSYPSYWLALHGDINRLTLFCGWTSPDMLWKHYHRVCKQRDAAIYWSITPPASTAAKVVSISRAA